MQFCTALLTGKAKAAKGLARDPATRRQEVAAEARALLSSCVLFASQQWNSAQDQQESLWRSLARSCIELELELNADR